MPLPEDDMDHCWLHTQEGLLSDHAVMWGRRCRHGSKQTKTKAGQCSMSAVKHISIRSAARGKDHCLQNPDGTVCDGCIDRTGFPLLAVICPHSNPVLWGTERDFLARQRLTLLLLNGVKNASLYNSIASFHFSSI